MLKGIRLVYLFGSIILSVQIIYGQPQKLHVRLNEGAIRSTDWVDSPANLCLFRYNYAKLKSVGYNVIVPEIKKAKDTAVAFLTFNQGGEKLSDNYRVVFIFNYKSADPTIIYSDSSKNSVQLNTKIKTAKYNDELIFIENSKKLEVRYKIIKNNIPIENRSPFAFPKMGLDTISPIYWPIQIPLFIKGGDIRINNVVVRMGAIDANQNGSYNDFEDDFLFIAKSGSMIIPAAIQSGSCVPVKKDLTFEIADSIYIVTAIDKKGNAIELKKISNKGVADISLFTKLPKVSYMDLASGFSKNLESNLEKGKLLYVYFWNTRCEGCVVYISTLKKIYNNYPKQINLLGLNWEDHSPEMKSFIKQYHIEWDQGIVTNKVSIKLNQDRIPYGVLFKDDGTLIQANITPEEVEKKVSSIVR